jgi:hypothetical protein
LANQKSASKRAVSKLEANSPLQNSFRPLKKFRRNRFGSGLSFVFRFSLNIPLTALSLSPDGVTWTLLPAVDTALTKRYEEWQHSLFAKGRAFEPFK